MAFLIYDLCQISLAINTTFVNNKNIKMPKVLENLVEKLTGKGMNKSKAYAVATSQLQKTGKIKKSPKRKTAVKSKPSKKMY